MRVLLDTQCFVMAATKEWTALPKRIQRLLLDSGTKPILSVISTAEVASKNNIGKLRMPADRVSRAIVDLRLDVIPLTLVHTRRLLDLPLHHREPFDRLQIPTALAEYSAAGRRCAFPAL